MFQKTGGGILGGEFRGIAPEGSGAHLSLGRDPEIERDHTGLSGSQLIPPRLIGSLARPIFGRAGRGPPGRLDSPA